MATQTNEATLKLYANVMEEIKHRIAAIDAGTGGQLNTPAPFVREFCFLQIRMICELVALGCLVVHGDIEATQTKSMRKEWSAEAIINTLSGLHSDFFPIAVRHHRTEGGLSFEPATPPAMTKEEFLTLYGKCGGVLHRGGVKKLMKGQFPLQINFPEITAIAQKLMNLLSSHMIFTVGGKTVIQCWLYNPDNNMKVQVALSRAIPPDETILAKFKKPLR